MNDRLIARSGLASLLLALVAAPIAACAQVPVDEHGEVISTYEPAAGSAADQSLGNEDIPLMAEAELEDLVGPIALYPDDLLAVVLPAAAYPLQIMEAARFLEALEDDATLKPDPEWDDSVVALLNYPEVVELLNEDIDWTWRLGEAVIAQQQDVVGAIQSFRDRAYAAGNLKSDEYQEVSRDEGVIEITPVSDDVIYVPYYEPERVVVYQPRPVYYYYPRRYPVYYYPYPSSYAFDHGYFWGVTTAFTIGWISDGLHVYHHSYYGHPYFGRSYWWDRWWYRRPSITVYNTTYVRDRSVTVNRYYHGDTWRPRPNRRDYIPEDAPRVSVNRHYPSGRTVETRQRTKDRSRLERRQDTIREQLAAARRDAETRRQQPQVRGQVETRSERANRAAAERRETIQRQLREHTVREPRRATSEREQAVNPVRPQRQVHREPALRAPQPQRQVRHESTARQPQRQVRREPATRQVQPQQQARREPVVRQPQAQRQARAPAKSEPRRAEPQGSQSRQRNSDSRERTRRSDR